MKPVLTFYICKRDNHCNGRCSEECLRTSLPEHAVGEICLDPENHPERFERKEWTNYIYYMEKENKDAGT